MHNLAIQGILDHFQKQVDTVAEGRHKKTRINVIMLPDEDYRFMQYQGGVKCTNDANLIWCVDEQLFGKYERYADNGRV